MKNFVVGAIIGLVLIAIGAGMLSGKIKIPKQTSPDVVTTTATATTTETIVTVLKEKVDEQKDGVLFSIESPKILNAPILQKNIDDYIAGFKTGITQAAKDIDFVGASSNYSLNISYEVVRNDSKIVVIRMSAYEYTGGAHGNPSFAFFQYDTQTERMIREEEILINKKDPTLISVVTNALLNKSQYSFEDNGVKKSMFFDVDEDKQGFMSNVAENGNVAFAENGIIFKYGAYAIGPYVIGEPEVIIPYTEIQSFLTPYANTILK